jgi:hypothetical protein
MPKRQEQPTPLNARNNHVPEYAKDQQHFQ